MHLQYKCVNYVMPYNVLHFLFPLSVELYPGGVFQVPPGCLKGSVHPNYLNHL